MTTVRLPTGTPLDASDSGGTSRRRYYFDSRINSLVVFVFEGDYYVSTSPYEVLSTVLGSCIAVCIWDPVARCGGMNHFLLPSEATASDGLPSSQLRFGSYSIERLVNGLLARGGIRERLRVKIFGGANISSTQGNLGHANADFVEAYLKRERLAVVAQCLRGTRPRRVRFHAATGRAHVSILSHEKATSLTSREAQLASGIADSVFDQPVEIFAGRTNET